MNCLHLLINERFLKLIKNNPKPIPSLRDGIGYYIGYILVIISVIYRLLYWLLYRLSIISIYIDYIYRLNPLQPEKSSEVSHKNLWAALPGGPELTS